MRFDPEFKKALSQLPSEEKDKLILRLLKHDLVLANRLAFELLSTDSVQDRRAKVENYIKKMVERMANTFYSPGYLLVDMRYLSGEITEHVKTTKDKYGEASLNLLMLNEVLKYNGKKILEFTPTKTYTFGIYVIARAFKILLLIKALHEDYLVEFEDNLKKLGELIGDNPYLMKLAIANGLDVNWLYKAEIPNDIIAIHKDLRARGYLK